MKISKVSILTIVYNREKYIADRIESLLASSYQDWELIIVDEHFIGNFSATANGYLDKWKNIK